MQVSEPPAPYSVQAKHPKTLETAEEGFVSIRDAIARATDLVRAGYIVEITSATTAQAS
jgi:hypothetical protein